MRSKAMFLSQTHRGCRSGHQRRLEYDSDNTRDRLASEAEST